MDTALARRRSAGLLVLEGAGLAVTGVVAALTLDRDDAGLAGSLVGASLVGSLLLVLLARAVLRGRTWARTPSLVLQLIALLVGTDLAKGRAWVAAAVVMLIAGATVFHLSRLPRDEG